MNDDRVVHTEGSNKRPQHANSPAHFDQIKFNRGQCQSCARRNGGSFCEHLCSSCSNCPRGCTRAPPPPPPRHSDEDDDGEDDDDNDDEFGFFELSAADEKWAKENQYNSDDDDLDAPPKVWTTVYDDDDDDDKDMDWYTGQELRERGVNIIRPRQQRSRSRRGGPALTNEEHALLSTALRENNKSTQPVVVVKCKLNSPQYGGGKNVTLAGNLQTYCHIKDAQHTSREVCYHINVDSGIV